MTFVEQTEVYAFNDKGIPVEELNLFLKDRGVPDEVIYDMTYYGKLEIYNTLEETSVFEGYSSETVNLESNNLEIIPSTIPKSQLELNVSGFINTDGTYTIYPSFIWKVRARLRNDTFSFVLDNRYWDTVAGDVGLNIHMKNAIPGHDETYYIDRPTTSHYSGHAFRVPSNIGTNNHLHYEGHGHFKARPREATVDRRIILSYGDDTRSFFTGVSYGISIGLFNVTYSNTPNKFRETAETLSW